jgi:hypothetical protein
LQQLSEARLGTANRAVARRKGIMRFMGILLRFGLGLEFGSGIKPRLEEPSENEARVRSGYKD